MIKDTVNNVHISAEDVLVTPESLSQELPVSEKALEAISQARKTISDIIHRRDHRMLVVCGPCSIHDIDAAKEYALRLKELHESCKDTLFIVMRVYFEKPRTTTGWKGLINDPHIDGTFDIETGLRKARELLIWLAELELPVATEALDPISPQYLAELFSWSAIGARTSESQTHREMASGLSMPVGFKNGTDGSLSVAINAIKSSRESHHFLGLNEAGQITVYETKGNRYSHVVLRGGMQPNYDKSSVALCEKKLNKEGLPPRIMIDCSHGNSNKDFNLQSSVAHNCIDQVLDSNQSIIGFMLESNINEGSQKISEDLSQLKYGVSLTDACMSWNSTKTLLSDLAERLRMR